MTTDYQLVKLDIFASFMLATHVEHFNDHKDRQRHSRGPFGHLVDKHVAPNLREQVGTLVKVRKLIKADLRSS